MDEPIIRGRSRPLKGWERVPPWSKFIVALHAWSKLLLLNNASQLNIYAFKMYLKP